MSNRTGRTPTSASVAQESGASSAMVIGESSTSSAARRGGSAPQEDRQHTPGTCRACERDRGRDRGSRWIAVLSVSLVAAVAAIVSYSHMQDVAARAGEGWRAWIEPLSVDGLLVGASQVVARRPRAWLAWLAVLVGLLVSLGANLAAAGPDLMSKLVNAWPAVALALSYETLLTQVRHHHTPEEGQMLSPGQFEERKPEAVELPDDADEDAVLLERARREIDEGRRQRIRVGRSRLAEALDITPSQARKLLERIAEESQLRVVE